MINMFQVYKLLKARLSSIAPCFRYTGQYLAGNDNTSYKVPAVFIELSNDLPIQYFPGGIQSAKCILKIHSVTHAPYKSHDNSIQDNSIAFHVNINVEIENLLSGWNIQAADGKLNSQQLIPANYSIGNTQGTIMFSVLSFSTEINAKV